jgi:hypothetical protein
MRSLAILRLRLAAALSLRPHTQALRRSGGKERVCDTLDLEVLYMRRAFGPLWGMFLKRAGLTQIQSR